MTPRISKLAWIGAIAGMGLLIAFATRWYWGTLAFLMLAFVLLGADLTRWSRARHEP